MEELTVYTAKMRTQPVKKKKWIFARKFLPFVDNTGLGATAMQFLELCECLRK